MRAILVLLLVLAAAAGFFFVLNKDVAPSPGTSGPAGLTNVEQRPDQPEEIRPTVELERPKAPERVLEGDVKTPEVAATFVAGPDTGSGQVTGTVVDAEGKEVSGAALRLTRYGAANFFDIGGPRTPDLEGKTNKDGTFVLTGVPAFSQYSLVVTHPRFSRYERAPVVVLEGQTTKEPNIVMTPGVGLAGRITDTGGANVRGATISLSLTSVASLLGDTSEVMTVKSDAEGRYQFGNLAQGNYSLNVVADGYGSVDIQNLNVVGEQGTTRDVVLDVAHMIAGTVRSEDGAPLKDVEIQAWSMDNRQTQSRSSVRSDEQGQFIVQDVPQGQYRLIAQHPAYDMADRNLRAETGDMSLQILMRPFPKVSGQVYALATGLPVTNFTAQLRTPVQGSQTATSAVPDSRQSFVNPEGRFELTARRPGEYKVQVTADGFAITLSTSFVVPQSGDVGNIRVGMIQGGSVRGRIVDGAGKPVSGARVTSFQNDFVDDMFARALQEQNLWFATEATTTTGADGTFKLVNLMPETYRIVIKHPEYAETFQTGILVTDGNESAVRDVILPKGSKVSGIVYGPNGRPLAGALVTLQGEAPFAGSTPGGPYTTRTDEAGKYVILNVKQGAYGAHASRPQATINNPFQDGIDAAATKVTLTVRDGADVETQDFTLSGQ